MRSAALAAPRLVVTTKHRVESGIPIPPRKPLHLGGGRPRTSPVYVLSVGDSFFVPARTRKADERARGAASAAARIAGFKIVTRAVDGGVRIWRTA